MEDEKLKIYAKLYSDELERHSNTRIEKKSLVQENLDLKKQNTELAKVLRKSVRIVKQMDADVSNRKEQLIGFLQWFFDNETKIEGDPDTKDFVDIFLNQ